MMKRRDFFKGILGMACCLPLVKSKNGSSQVLHPPHGKRKGILTIPQALSRQEVEHIRKHWHMAASMDKPIILTGGIKYEEVNIHEETEIRTEIHG